MNCPAPNQQGRRDFDVLLGRVANIDVDGLFAAEHERTRLGLLVDAHLPVTAVARGNRAEAQGHVCDDAVLLGRVVEDGEVRRIDER